MLTLSDQQIFEIAEFLDSGMRCFYHRKTGEIKTILDSDYYGEDDESLQDEIEENWGDYYEFERMSSHESYEIMADFAETVDNEELQDKLIDALRRRKPFRHFKDQIDNSGEYRQKWFDYKKKRLFEFVKEQITSHNLCSCSDRNGNTL